MVEYKNTVIIKSHKHLVILVEDMKKSLEAITKWLKKSGLKVNDDKTELCLFIEPTKDMS